MTPSNPKTTQQEIKDAPMWLSITIGIFLVLLGVGVAYYTFNQNQISKILDKKGIEVKGMVTFVDRTKTNENDKMNHYTLTYSYNNDFYTYKTSLKYTYYSINEQLVLLINPDKPSQAMLMNEEDRNQGSYLWALFFIAAGILIIVYKRKAVKKTIVRIS